MYSSTPKQQDFIISLFEQLHYSSQNSSILKDVDTKLAINKFKNNIYVDDWAKSLTINEAKDVISELLNNKNKVNR